MKETLEEAAEKIYPIKIVKLAQDFEMDVTCLRRSDFKKGANWQAERMYTEEDMREAFSASDEGWASFTHWLEQFKKK